MERVAFMVDQTGERIECLLNPEHFLLRREAGVVGRQANGGLLTGTELADDPLLFTGGGTTELTMNLLFDVSLVDPPAVVQDVRELTGALWQLSENARNPEHFGTPPIARVVWGKAVNFPGVIVAIAERLEYFNQSGIPRRAWIRLRMLRVAETDSDLVGGSVAPPLAQTEEELASALSNPLEHELSGAFAEAGAESSLPAERLDQLAYRYYGDPTLWRLIAWGNRLADPFHLNAGARLDIPTASPGGAP